jgi:hypothetical protein
MCCVTPASVPHLPVFHKKTEGITQKASLLRRKIELELDQKVTRHSLGSQTLDSFRHLSLLENSPAPNNQCFDEWAFYLSKTVKEYRKQKHWVM